MQKAALFQPLAKNICLTLWEPLLIRTKTSIFLVGASIIERVLAILLQIGLSILVFYACKDKKKFWLFPLAIILHSLTDFTAGLNYVKVTNFSILELEVILVVSATITFCSAYFLLYKKDSSDQAQG